MRFGQLQHEVPTITPRMLTRQLRELEADGLVARTVHAESPPQVEHGLTALGRSLSPVVEQLKAWGEHYCSSARESRASALPS